MPLGSTVVENAQTPEVRRKELDKLEQEFLGVIDKAEKIKQYQDGVAREIRSIKMNITVLNTKQSEKEYCAKENILYKNGRAYTEISLEEIFGEKRKCEPSENKYIINPEEFLEQIDTSITRIKLYNGYIIQLDLDRKLAQQGLNKIKIERQQLDEAESLTTAFSILKRIFN